MREVAVRLMKNDVLGEGVHVSVGVGVGVAPVRVGVGAEAAGEVCAKKINSRAAATTKIDDCRLDDLWKVSPCSDWFGAANAALTR